MPHDEFACRSSYTEIPSDSHRGTQSPGHRQKHHDDHRHADGARSERPEYAQAGGAAEGRRRIRHHADGVAHRAVDHHGGSGRYPLQFFTREAVRDLRLSAMRQSLEARVALLVGMEWTKVQSLAAEVRRSEVLP